jgi:cyclic pyranopterin phosphate synthase
MLGEACRGQAAAQGGAAWQTAAVTPYRNAKPGGVLTAPVDALGRPMTSLRLSVIDRCNFRCIYCMPEASLRRARPFLSNDELLDNEQLLRLVNAFVDLGVGRVRLTGGEPLLRPGLIDLVQRIAHIPGVRDLSMTTNAVLLPRLANDLAEAGLNRITVSLDSLDEAVFARMTGRRGSAAEVLRGIRAAELAGFTSLKINCVVRRGVNDHTVMELLDHFRGSGHTVRLIEFLGTAGNGWSESKVVPGEEWLQRIHARWPLQPLESVHAGETARRYAYADGAGEIGLIDSVTRPFCEQCNRVRVTAEGNMHTCLYSTRGVPLRPLLETADDARRLREVIRDAWLGRADRYSKVRRVDQQCGADLEMYRMGG